MLHMEHFPWRPAFIGRRGESGASSEGTPRSTTPMHFGVPGFGLIGGNGAPCGRCPTFTLTTGVFMSNGSGNDPGDLINRIDPNLRDAAAASSRAVRNPAVGGADQENTAGILHKNVP